MLSRLPDVSATEANWAREKPVRFWDPPRKLVCCIRSYQHWVSRRGLFAHVLKCAAVLRHRFWTVITGADVPLNCQIGGGFRMPHPNGVVIHPKSVIGVNCTIFQQVTLGTKYVPDECPVLEGHVDVGAGAKILGAVRIGVHAKIGANAVVTKDVPSGRTAVGIPARVID